jgi:glycerophosphoryl diester phosphodiesterase
MPSNDGRAITIEAYDRHRGGPMNDRRVATRGATAVLVVLAACSSSTTNTASCAASPFRRDVPLVIAHAGDGGLAPANTMYALELGRAAGADMLDLDVRMTADGVVVARHDRELSTTTDGKGPVDEATWAEIAELDAAATWTGDPPDRPVGVLRVRDALEAFPDDTFSLEIKQTTPSMVDPLCDVLTATGSRGRVFISSNDDVATYAFRDACPGVTITTTYQDLDDRDAAEAAGTFWCWPSPINQPPFDAISDRLTAAVTYAHEHGGAIFTWVVDDPDELRRLAEAGVDGVYTDRPDVARQVFDDLAG